MTMVMSAAGPAVEASTATASVLPTFSAPLAAQFRTDLTRADELGMRPRVFAKIGDSNTASFYAFYGLGCRRPMYSGFKGLRAVVDRYTAATLPQGWPVPWGVPAPGDCTPGNSFTRYSSATRSGIQTKDLARPITAIDVRGAYNLTPNPACDVNESMTLCELKKLRPRYAIISVGTNDEAYWQATGQAAVDRFSMLVDQVRDFGSIPVLMTLPPRVDSTAETHHWDYIVEINRAITQVASTKRVPLVDIWAAFTAGNMVNYGLESEGGTHLDTIGGWQGPNALNRSVDFRRDALRYGNNRRNLLLLRTLKVLDRQAGVATASRKKHRRRH
ncbi:MAG: SGNH/GDSL hydrolase family protein [Solirubrobacterales bacterium]|nr:SGNH/GDSL hydrolase family protein [Solirubrobacterales bacterium]